MTYPGKILVLVAVHDRPAAEWASLVTRSKMLAQPISARAEELRRLVQAGRYRVDSRDLAAAMLTDARSRALLGKD